MNSISKFGVRTLELRLLLIKGQNRVFLKSMNTKKLIGAKHWLGLTEHAVIPILNVSAKLLTKQIKAGASLADMSHTVARDPALCWHLFSAANLRNKNPDVEILSLQHVITILGMQGVVNVVKKAPQFPLHASDAYQKAYLQAQSNSSFAGILVEHWAQQMHLGSAEKMKWATILAGVPMWLMWRCAYPQMRLWQWQTIHRKQGFLQAEQDIFGCELEDICRMLGRKLALPHLTQTLLEQAERPTLKQWAQIQHRKHLNFADQDLALRHVRRHGTTLMSLMLHLAQQVPIGWFSHTAIRAQQILANLCGKGVESVMTQNHKLAVENSHQVISSHVMMPAISLLWPNQPRFSEIELRQPIQCISSKQQQQSYLLEYVGEKAKRKNPPVKNQIAKPIDNNHHVEKPMESLPARSPNKTLLTDLISQFTNQVGSFKDIHEILLTTNKAIHEGLGMRRASILVLNKQGDGLRPLYCVGIENDSPIRSLSIPLAQNRFFGKLLSKTASYKVDRDNYSQVQKMLHQDTVSNLTRKNFMVMSLFASGKPIGVVYADASEEEDFISDTEYNAFKKICQSTCLALDGYAQKRRTG